MSEGWFFVVVIVSAIAGAAFCRAFMYFEQVRSLRAEREMLIDAVDVSRIFGGSLWVHSRDDSTGLPRLRRWCWCERRTGPHEHTDECPQEGQE